MINRISKIVSLLIFGQLILLSCQKNILSNTSGSRMMSVYDGAPRIKTFSIQTLSDSVTRLRIEVEGTGTELGSFYVRQNPPVSGGLLPKFFLHPNGYRYLYGDSIPNKDLNLLDNGIRDEDSAVNVFSFTFDPRDFDDTTTYHFQTGWHNRPQTGTYTHDSRFFYLVGGKIDTMPSANIDSVTHRIIYQKDGIYAAFPSMNVFNDSVISVSFATRVNRSHIDPEGGSKNLVSYDNGITWNTPSIPTYDELWRTTGSNLVLPDVQGWIYVSDTLRDSLVAEKRIIMDVKPGTIAYMGGAIIRR